MHVSPSALIRLTALLLACAVAGPAAAQNPWAVPPAAPAPGGAPAPAQRPAPGFGTSEGGAVPGFLRPVVDTIAAAQRELNRTLSREFRSVRETGSSRALLIVTGVAFIYGVLHAAGPGHGKLVVSSFFLARQARVMAGILTGSAISFLQAVTSIGLVCGLGVVLGQHGFDVLGHSVWLEALSYALIVAMRPNGQPSRSERRSTAARCLQQPV